MSNDLEITYGTDFNMDEVDDMPQFVNDIDGIYSCSLSLSRDTGERNDKPYDNIVFAFTIKEALEEKVDHGVSPEDMVYVRFSLIKSKKDLEENRKDSYGLRMAKPLLVALKDSLGTGSSLNDILKESQDVAVTATFATRKSQVKQDDGSVKEYSNINIKKLIVA